MGPHSYTLLSSSCVSLRYPSVGIAPQADNMPRIKSSLRPDWTTIDQAVFRDSFRRIGSLSDLAAFIGIAPSQLAYYALRVNKTRVYTKFQINRRNGRKRQIQVPSKTLKYIQRLIHEALTRVYGPHRAVHGFRLGRSIKTNAENHVGHRYVLNLDLSNFFPSITRRRIYNRLVAAPYTLHPNVANVIAALATDAYGQLPQGSPCSPVIANMIAAELDTDLANLCKLLRCWYTRYADDITISTLRGDMPPQLARYPTSLGTGQAILGDRLRNAIEKQGFSINEAKTRLYSNWTRQVCTGLVVNRMPISPPRSYVRHLRSLIDHWMKNGWQDAAQVLHASENRQLFGSREQLFNHVVGRIAYLKMIRGADDSVSERLSLAVTAIAPGH